MHRNTSRAVAVLAFTGVACANDSGVVLPSGYGDGLTGRAFTRAGTRHTVADLSQVALRLSFDIAAHDARGHAEIQFRTVETGVPFFLLEPTATAATLNGNPIQLDAMRDPDDVVTLMSTGVQLEQFLSYLATTTDLALDATFERYVYDETPPTLR
jgi:hypothetical protein